jgi:hypothetical protein
VLHNDIEASLAAGFHEHLIKPVDWPKLEAAVIRLAARLQIAQNASPNLAEPGEKDATELIWRERRLFSSKHGRQDNADKLPSDS